MLQIFFIFIILNTYVPLIFHAKIQPKISSGSGEEVDFVIFAVFSNIPYQYLNSPLAGDFRSPTSRLAGDQKVSCQPAGRRHFLLVMAAILDIRPDPIL